MLRKLHELRSEHRDLDTVIARLADGGLDQLQLQRLKKRKLLLKDEVAWLERPPDPGQHRLMDAPRIGVIMGSQSDWTTLRHTADTLLALDIAHEVRIVSAHRTPDRLADYAKTAAARGLSVIIAGAGGAAHLPGMCAAWTALPVLGVPVESHALKGMDSLLSIVQMPAGIPVGTLAIGHAGAVNAALLSAAILALDDPALAGRLAAYRSAQTNAVADIPTDLPS